MELEIITILIYNTIIMSEYNRIYPGIVVRDRYYREKNIHLISNYWGLESLMECPLPKRTLNLAFISTASTPYPTRNEPCKFLDAERAWLEKKKAEGRINYFEYCIGNKKPEEIKTALQNLDILFVGGGNTAYLLQKIQESGAAPIIKELVEDKVWYFGKSAGAIVAGPDIDPWGFILGSMATRDLDSTQGIGLTQVYPLPHVDTDSFMNNTHKGKNGYRYLAELAHNHPVAVLLDNTNK